MEVVNTRDKVSKEHNYMNKQQPILQETTHNISPPQTTTTSPAHEFSFTISLNPQPPPISTQHTHNNHCLTPPPPEPPLTAVDLSPADDIFFHGHLLPLQLLSIPISPRSSTNSIDGFTLPMKEIVNDQHNNPIGNTSFHHHHNRNTFSSLNIPTNNINQTKPKSKSFSIFKTPILKKGTLDEGGVMNNNNNPKKKLRQEVAQLIKRYVNMVKPFMLFSKTKKANNNTEYNPKPHSFSSNFLSSGRSLPVGMSRGGMRRGKFSAPASIRTSPANSGILRTSGTLSPAKSTASDSTMEELQAAIQAAIAHCKNSIANDDKVQS